MKFALIERPREVVARLLRSVHSDGGNPKTIRVGVMADQLLRLDVHPGVKFSSPAHGDTHYRALAGIRYIVDPAVDSGAVYIEEGSDGKHDARVSGQEKVPHAASRDV